MLNKSFPKIWFFDMEGTLLKKEHSLDNGKVAPSGWTVLAKALGDDCFALEEASKDKWLKGQYSGYLDWMKDSVEIQKSFGLRSEHIDELTKNAVLHNGSEELFLALKSRGAVTALVSGGIKSLADKVQRQLKIDHALSGCEYFFNESGELEFYNLLPSDNYGKVAFMQQICFEHGVSPSDCIFVGDGMNDIYLAQEVGSSIAFNAQPQLEEVATYIIRQEKGDENLSEIISLFS